MSLSPKHLNQHVTNLELVILMATGFLLGSYWRSAGWLEWMVVSFGPFALIYWWRGYCGLDQWPNPRGRYYDEWLAIKGGTHGEGDYFQWLARRMGNRQPWAEWAKLEAGE